MNLRILILSFVAMCMFGAPSLSAQEPSGSDAGIQEKKEMKVTPDMVSSLFFTYWQHQAISDAKNSRGVVRPPTEAELRAMENDEDFVPEVGPREVALGGIVYKSDKDWVIWINDQRITPTAVPEEVLDLRVFEDYIEVKWIDKNTEKIYPIRLKAHQRFNLDTRIFFTGEFRE